MKKAQFVVFEGLDGAGTSTQLDLLKTYCQEQNLMADFTEEPTTNTAIGKLLRSILQKQVTVPPEALQLIFCADRSAHLKDMIEPALQAGKTVFCDRYIASTLAFGSLALDEDWLCELNRHFPTPDLTIFFDAPPKLCMERIQKRGNQEELFEKEAVLEKVYAAYQRLFQAGMMERIDATAAPAEVFEQIKQQLIAREII